jgi:hypothetical protein
VTRPTIGGRVDAAGLGAMAPRCAACGARGPRIEALIDASGGPRPVLVCKPCAAAVERSHLDAASVASRILARVCDE